MKDLDPDELATGLIRVAPDGRITWLNRAAADLLSPPGLAVVGRRMAELSPALGEWCERVETAQRPLHAPETALDDGGLRFDASLRPGREGILIELHPVAERVRQRQLAERADRQGTLTLMARRLAHELRNPLAGIRGAAQLIAAQPGDAASARHAAMIQREVDRTTRLIEHFAGERRSAPAALNLHHALDEAAELVLAEQQGRVELERDFDPSIPELVVDAGQLHQLFLNLLRNSAQAGARRIRIVTRIEHHSPLIDEPGGQAVRVDIEDDGGGVPDELRDRLFLPLATGRDQGSGFGLAVVQQIARAHGGLVEYRPLARGSRFSLRLPLKAAASERAHG